MFVTWGVVFERSKAVQLLTISPATRTHALHISGFNDRQTVRSLQHDSADAGSLPKRDVSMANSNYFQ